MERIVRVPAEAKSFTPLNQDATLPKFTLSINDSDPEEQLEYLAAAITTSLRWYAQTKDKRKGDDQHAIVLIDFLQDLQLAKAS